MGGKLLKDQTVKISKVSVTSRRKKGVKVGPRPWTDSTTERYDSVSESCPERKT